MDCGWWVRFRVASKRTAWTWYSGSSAMRRAISTALASICLAELDVDESVFLLCHRFGHTAQWHCDPNALEELGRAERTGVGQVMPSLRVRDFNFASLSDAV
jgi:hypothetical protein